MLVFNCPVRMLPLKLKPVGSAQIAVRQRLPFVPLMNSFLVEAVASEQTMDIWCENCPCGLVLHITRALTAPAASWVLLETELSRALRHYCLHIAAHYVLGHRGGQANTHSMGPPQSRSLNENRQVDATQSCSKVLHCNCYIACRNAHVIVRLWDCY